VAVPVTQTCQWRFLLHSCYTDRSLAVPLFTDRSLAVPVTLLLHRQVSGDSCYTDRSVAVSVTLLSHRQVGDGSCYTDRSVAVCYINISVAVPVTQTRRWRFLLDYSCHTNMSVAVPVTQTRRWRFLLDYSCHTNMSVAVPVKQVLLKREVSGGMLKRGQWRFLLHREVSSGSCYINVSRCSCSTDRSMAVPVPNRSVAVAVRQISGGSRYTDRSVTLLVTQTGSLAVLS
jgi:hypothetical protein